MAITLITTPNTIAALYNPIPITASTTNLAQPSFRYIVEIAISFPVTVTKKLKISPRPDGYLLFDAHRILESYASFDFNVGEATDAATCAGSYVTYQLKVGEEYAVAGVITEHLNLAGTGTIRAINAGVRHSISSYGTETDRINLNIPGQYAMSVGTVTVARKFLTTMPRTQPMRVCSTDNYYLYVATTSEPHWLQLKTYDASGAQIGTANKTLTTGQNNMIRVGVGPYNITAWNAANLVGASSYTVTLTNNSGSGNALGETLAFVIDCDCSKYAEKFRLHWLNPLGGFDAFSFKMRNDRTLSAKKGTYTKILGSMSSGAFSFSPSQAGKVVFDAVSTEQITVNCNNITEDESAWLWTLAKSSQVFWEISSTVFVPVTVTDSKFSPDLYATKKLFNARFTIEISNEIISQRQ